MKPHCSSGIALRLKRFLSVLSRFENMHKIFQRYLLINKYPVTKSKSKMYYKSVALNGFILYNNLSMSISGLSYKLS